MNAKQFETYAETVFTRCMDVLANKACEYAEDDDRMHNFVAAGALRQEKPITALEGMMVKHTISIYDLLRHYRQDPTYWGGASLELWREKITDQINYLVCLEAMLHFESIPTPETSL